MFNLCNFVAYQLAWFAVLISAARGQAWAGTALALLLAAVHLALRREARELRVIVVALLLGLVIDSTLAFTGQVRFADAWPRNFAPYWMLALWIAFATTLNHSLSWLMSRPFAAAIAGAIGGPLAYLAGGKIGALTMAVPAAAMPLIALLWAPAMLVLSSVVMRHAVLPASRRVSA